ncbi:hypothetical protein QAD02_020824 [Eretmocerus hayati]|uniref:Uncharacterized protein n=1 Tax=Eretmocerus hayati TaxID=131215 RepID=A0ACC2PQF0_9HYME|nr:hypothetical protein QAD02_020824 [Eretmocerus hayati]
MVITDIRDFAKYIEEHKHQMDYLVAASIGTKQSKLSFKVIEVDGHEHVIIHDEVLVFTLRDATTWYIDATFAILPKIKGVKQFLTIMFGTYGKALPVFYVIMTGRKTKDYNKILKGILGIFPSLKPKFIMTDYEKGLRKSLRGIFKGVRLLGCWFHFCQALFRQALKKEAAIEKNKKCNGEKHMVLKRLMALARLPHLLIGDAYTYIVEDCRREFGTYFDSLITYFNDEWMKIVGAKGFSVYRSRETTNNYMETYHARMTDEIGKYPPSNKFVRKIIERNQFTWLQVETLRGGRCPSNPTIDRQAKIQKYVEELEDGILTPNQFVWKCAQVDTIQDVIDSDDDDASDGGYSDGESSDGAEYLKNDMQEGENDETPELPRPLRGEVQGAVCEEAVADFVPQDMYEESNNCHDPESIGSNHLDSPTRTAVIFLVLNHSLSGFNNESPEISIPHQSPVLLNCDELEERVVPSVPTQGPAEEVFLADAMADINSSSVIFILSITVSRQESEQQLSFLSSYTDEKWSENKSAVSFPVHAVQFFRNI